MPVIDHYHWRSKFLPHITTPGGFVGEHNMSHAYRFAGTDSFDVK
jgi:hypothetical protein